MISLHKRLSGFAIVFTLLTVFVFIVPSASVSAEAAHSSSQMAASRGGTGGCSAKTIAGSQDSAFAEYAACISLSFDTIYNYSPLPDSYFTFGGQNPSLWSACSLTIDMIDRKTGGTVTTTSYSCLKEARESATDFRYAGLEFSGYAPSGHVYYNRVRLYGVYAGHEIFGQFAYSPDLSVN